MTAHALHCKFCQLPITVEADLESYAKLGGSPKALLAMACCNFCSDIRVERRARERTFARICRNVQLLGPDDKKSREAYLEILLQKTKAYAGMIARWNRLDGSVWDESVAQTMLDNPTKWPEILGRLWTMFRQWQEQQRSEEQHPELIL